MKNEILEFLSEFFKEEEEEGSYSTIQFMRVGAPVLPEEDEHDFYDFYILVNVETGERISDLYFDDYKVFADGVAPVCVDNNRWGYIKESGEWLIKPQYKKAFSSVNRVLRLVDDDGMIYLYSAITGEPLAAGFDSVVPFERSQQEFPYQYIVGRGASFGILSSEGEWLLPLTACEKIFALTRGLAFVKYSDGSGEIRRVFTKETLVSGKYFEFVYYERFGVIYCSDEEERLAVYRPISNPGVTDYVQLLFAEYGETIRMLSPDIVQLFNGETNTYAMFSISKNQWMHTGLTKIECCNPKGVEYYQIWNDSVFGVTDMSGEILIPLELKTMYCNENGVLLAWNRGGWGAYSLREKKWLFLPQANLVKELSGECAFALGEARKGFFNEEYVWRYFVDGKFLWGEYTTCNDFHQTESGLKAKVKTFYGGIEGWLSPDGTFEKAKKTKKWFVKKDNGEKEG